VVKWENPEMNTKDKKIIIICIFGTAVVTAFLTIFFFGDISVSQCKDMMYGNNKMCKWWSE
jgi:hypothetical protein